MKNGLWPGMNDNETPWRSVISSPLRETNQHSTLSWRVAIDHQNRYVEAAAEAQPVGRNFKRAWWANWVPLSSSSSLTVGNKAFGYDRFECCLMQLAATQWVEILKTSHRNKLLLSAFLSDVSTSVHEVREAAGEY